MRYLQMLTGDDDFQANPIDTTACGVEVPTIGPHKLDVPNSVTFLIVTPTFELYVVWCGSPKGYQEDICSKRDWTAFLKYENHFGTQ